jgi:hypothetical protein
MQFQEFLLLLETQTISQYIKTQRELPPELYKKVKIGIKQAHFQEISRLMSMDLYANWATYWGIKEYFSKKPGIGNYYSKSYDYKSLKTPNPNQKDINDCSINIVNASANILRPIQDFVLAHLSDNNIQSKFNTIEYTPEQAKKDSEDWHYRLSLKQSRAGGQGQLLLKLDRLGPQWVGWKWLNLKRGFCRQEGDAAGHCGNIGAKDDDNIFSLRDPENRVHLTFIINNGILGEMKGRGNAKPSPKYHSPIIELLKSKNVGSIHGGGWDPTNNFALTDLPEETQKQLIKKKPFLNSPFKYAIQNIKDDKQLLEKINELFKEPIESIYTNKDGTKDAVIESFSDFEEVEEQAKRRYTNSKIDSISWLDEIWEHFDSNYAYSNDALQNYLDSLNKENTKLLEKYLDKELEEFENDEDEEDELSIYEKLQKEDGDIKAAVHNAICDGMTAGTENEAWKDVRNDLCHPDDNGFYFDWWVQIPGKKQTTDQIQLRISLLNLEELFNKGFDDPGEAVEIRHSQPYNGYSDFDNDTFNERLKDLLHDISKNFKENTFYKFCCKKCSKI